MDNKTYNEYLTTLFQNCSIQMYMNGTNIKLEEQIDTMFQQLADVYNNKIAVDFISELSFKHKTLLEKIDNYPEMLWRTSISKKIIQNDLINLVNNSLLEMYKKQEEIKNYDEAAKKEYIITLIKSEDKLLTELKTIGLKLAKDKSNISEIVSILKPALEQLVNISEMTAGSEKGIIRMIKSHHLMDNNGNVLKLEIDPIELNKVLVEKIKIYYDEINKKSLKEKFNM